MRAGLRALSSFPNSVATSEEEFARPGKLDIFLTFPVSQISETNRESLAQSKGRCFDGRWPSWPVEGGRGWAERKIKAECTSSGVGIGGTLAPVNRNSGRGTGSGRMEGKPGTSTLLGGSVSGKADLLHGHLDCRTSKQKQNETKQNKTKPS